MALTKKPTQSKLSKAQEDELITQGALEPERYMADAPLKTLKKGGRKKQEPLPEDETPVPVQLRLEPKLIDKIDEVRKKRFAKVSRHAWFLEAIDEKIQREQNR